MTADEYLTLLAEIDPEVAEVVRQHKTRLERVLSEGTDPSNALLFLLTWNNLPGGQTQGGNTFGAMKKRLRWFQ